MASVASLLLPHFTRSAGVELEEDICSKKCKGRPVMFFLAQEREKVQPNVAEVGNLEGLLIQVGVPPNPSLGNTRGNKQARWQIPGIVRSGRGKPSAPAL